MKKYIIDPEYLGNTRIKFKSEADVCETLLNNGFEYKKVYISQGTSIPKLLKKIPEVKRGVKKALNELPNDSLILFNYPWSAMNKSLFKNIKSICTNKNMISVAFIQDINIMRTSRFLGKIYFKFIVGEYKNLNNFDFIICHNPSMKKHLISKGINEEKLIVNQIMDYLVDGKPNEVKFAKEVNLAGNLSLEKAKYVYKLNELNNKNYKFNLFGKNYEGISNDFLDYKGFFDPQVLISKIDKGFGLVWDGSSLDLCDGTFGNYLRYNNPCKFSNYMACGVPVIVWEKSALAPFVKEHKVGFTVKNLHDIEDLMKNITKEEYNICAENVKKIQKKVNNGEYVLSSIDEILKRNK